MKEKEIPMKSQDEMILTELKRYFKIITPNGETKIIVYDNEKRFGAFPIARYFKDEFDNVFEAIDRGEEIFDNIRYIGILISEASIIHFKLRNKERKIRK